MDPSVSAPELKRQRRRLRFILQIAISAALGGFLFGYDTAVINGAVGAIGEVFQVSSGDLGRAVASALIGSAIGALAAGWLSDRIGRRHSMVVAAVLFLASAIGSALAQSLTGLIVWRVIGGLGVGFASVLAPAYIAEVSPRRPARPSGIAAAAGDRGGDFSGPAVRLRDCAVHPGSQSRVSRGSPGGMALDVVVGGVA